MSDATKVWIVDDDESIRWVLEKALQRVGMDVQSFPGAAELLDALQEDTPDVLICDIRMPGVNGLELMERVHSAKPDLPVIIVTAHSDLDAAVAAFKGGAFEYLPKPFDVDGVATLVQRAAAKRVAVTTAPQAADRPAIIGAAPAMQDVFRAIGRLAASQITVLITGESGTGKELIARALHTNSPRASKPFIAINTAAIPKDLLESEFFGHERGAFTGAQMQRKGRFEQADGGSLFLDEIGDMPADLQTRLLRVLQDGQFYRVGGVSPVNVDVRIIAATHQNLEKAVQEGRFREDLFHRLNVIRVRIPPLRERREDIELLLRHFLDAAAKELKTEPKQLLPEVLERLKAYDWLGNVRQLENACRWLTVMAPGRDIHLQDLPPELRAATAAVTAVEAPAPAADTSAPQAAAAPAVVPAATGSWNDALGRWAEARLAAGQSDLLGEAAPLFERTLINVALAACKGQRQEAARRLGWGRNTLTRKIKELGIDD
ncbi:nitrogen regulation protein NR(I) [Nevskia soli]|uniref:nitrogen regulation protein NR(I) n=1 Tax=Nevskia soli TaxID=418856 RepID=UPI0004A71F60|nr:nitrogen regulation protein NR(I) [Nevskia soli]